MSHYDSCKKGMAMDDKRPSLWDLYTRYKLDNDALFTLAKLAGVAKSIIAVMLINSPVEESDTMKMLNALSRMMGEHWTLANTNVALVKMSYG